ncbi:MAG TPA: hypothetical protein VIK41_08410 [Gemmatimonadaceae bacterium]
MPANEKAPSKKPAPSTKPLWQKLFIKGGTVLLVNAPASYATVLDGSPAKVTTRVGGNGGRGAPVRNRRSPVQGGRADNDEEHGAVHERVDRLSERRQRVPPKQLGALAKSFGLQPVSLVAIDDTWSALRVKRT